MDNDVYPLVVSRIAWTNTTWLSHGFHSYVTGGYHFKYYRGWLRNPAPVFSTVVDPSVDPMISSIHRIGMDLSTYPSNVSRSSCLSIKCLNLSCPILTHRILSIVSIYRIVELFFSHSQVTVQWVDFYRQMCQKMCAKHVRFWKSKGCFFARNNV